MSNPGILFASGTQGVTVWPDLAARVLPVATPVDAASLVGESVQRKIVDAALSASGLKELAKDKRRAAIYVGDLSRPAPYDLALPVLVKALVDAGIRPSRIAVAVCPGGGGALLGRAAIHRYGEEVCGEHEVNAWPESGTPGPLYDEADLRIALASTMSGAVFESFLPQGVTADFTLELTLGKKKLIEIESARAFAGKADSIVLAETTALEACDVLITSGGGSPWEETLEEALLSLNRPRVQAKTAVLIFSGVEGLGSARFMRDVWDMLEQAEAFLASGGVLKNSGAPGRFDAAGTLAACLSRYSNTVLLSAGLSEHSDGEDFQERLNAAPTVAGRLALCATHVDLWKALGVLHGENYALFAEPLGWRY